MIRQIGMLMMVAALGGCAQRSDAHSRSSTPSFDAALEEADRLRALVERRYGEGKFHGPANPAQAVMSDGNASAPPTTATRAKRFPTKCQNDGVARSGRSHGRERW